MRSHALHVARPLRSSSTLLLSPRRVLPTLSAPSILPAVQQTASIATSYPKKQTVSKTPTVKPAVVSNRTLSAKRAGSIHNPKNHPPSERPAGVSPDPQAAIPPAASVEDVDPALAGAIPTAGGSGSAPGAFAAGITASDGVSLGNGNGTTPGGIDWSSSFHGLSTSPFSAETAALLMKPLQEDDIEIKPDGIIYLPEIKYRRILNQAFGPGGWGLAPRGELVVGEKVVTREYALIVHGRFIAQARGECQYFSEDTIPTAGEGCKSNALLRCCKDLGIASELWDPRFIRAFKKAQCKEIWVEHVVNKKKRQIWVRKDTDPAYPYVAVKRTSSSA